MMSDFDSSGQLAGRIWKLRCAEVQTASAEELSYLATSDQFGIALELTLSASYNWSIFDCDIEIIETSGSASKPDDRDARFGMDFCFYLPDTALVTLENRTEDIEIYMSIWGGTLPRLYADLGPHDPWARLERFKLWISKNPNKAEKVRESILNRMEREGFLYQVQMQLHQWLSGAVASLEDKIAL